MRIATLTACLLLAACKTHSQKNSMQIDSPVKECSQFYSFNNNWYDLEHYQEADIGGKPLDFKDCSPFGAQFRTPIRDIVSFNSHVFRLSKDKYELSIVADRSSDFNTVKLPVPDPLPEVHEYYFSLLAATNGVVVIMEDYYGTTFTVLKYDEKGKELARMVFDHTFITHPDPKTNHHHRYLYLGYVTPKQLVFTSHMAFGEKDKTIVIGLDDFSKEEYDYKLSGIVLDGAQQYVKGYIVRDKNNFTVKFPGEGKEISFAIENGDGACATILAGGKLVVANYHPIATGSSLHCFDANTGAQLWKANVAQLNASHSEYYNNVYLSLYKNTVIMEGIEASGNYLQFFDLSSGKRLACHGIPGLGR